MKLNGKILVAVAMMMGSMAAVGCAAPTEGDAVAPEETAATAPVEESDSTAGVEQNSVRVRYGYGARHYYAPHAPPAARREVYGRAPSARHFWAPGYYRWNGRQHVWVTGRWEAQRVGYAYVGPQWERRDTRWEYIPGRWVRR
ncbi:Lipoprotein, putative [Minicystis rosea]|nr:Lipoprotein, putative [Minicystis rosea]